MSCFGIRRKPIDRKLSPLLEDELVVLRLRMEQKQKDLNDAKPNTKQEIKESRKTVAHLAKKTKKINKTIEALHHAKDRKIKSGQKSATKILKHVPLDSLSLIQEGSAPITCMICFEPKLPGNFAQLSESCEHERMCCNMCLASYMRSQYRGRGLPKCPMPSCHAHIDDTCAKRVLSEDEVSQFTNQTYAKEFFTVCGNADCRHGHIINDPVHHPHLTCERCNTKSCIWHKTCLKNDQCRICTKDTVDNQSNEEYIHTHTKKCPGCSVNIEKNEGCPHMTCQNCNCQFCWECRGAWPDDHASTCSSAYY